MAETTAVINSDVAERVIPVNDFQYKNSFRRSLNLEPIEGKKVNKFLSDKLKERVNFKNWHLLDEYESEIPVGVSSLIMQALESGFKRNEVFVVDPEFTNAKSDPALVLQFRRSSARGYYGSWHEMFQFLIPIIWVKTN